MKFTKRISVLIAPLLVGAGIIGVLFLAGTAVTIQNCNEVLQERLDEWEEQQRMIELFDLWCEEHGIVPEEPKIPE